MGMLDGGLAQSIYDGFQGQLLQLSLRKSTQPTSGGLDDAGDPLVPPEPADLPCEGFIDLYSAFTRAQMSIPGTDLKLCIFGKSLPDGTVPAKDDICQVTGPAGSIYYGRWYQLRDADCDPAGALWVSQSFEIKAPAP
jgi:hypothetical protein